jgi:pyridoxal phosphate enzyme (YggS family)
MATPDISIPANLAIIRERINRACERFNRDPASVHLLAVSKTKPIAMIEEAIGCGQRDFGENYLQDALSKIPEVDSAGVTWHYIGAIQSNKTRQIAENFDWVHTVASEKVARRLSAQRPAEASPLKVMVQVNISGEASKSGVEPGAVPGLVDSMAQYSNLEVRGLMAIPGVEPDFERQRESFARLRAVFDEIRTHAASQLDTFEDLSIGMSADLEAAVAEGATWLRIGTDIFGARKT